MPDPIAIQPNDSVNVKVHRSISSDLNLKSLSNLMGNSSDEGEVSTPEFTFKEKIPILNGNSCIVDEN